MVALFYIDIYIYIYIYGWGFADRWFKEFFLDVFDEGAGTRLRERLFFGAMQGGRPMSGT
jgi:hypothetical protein